MTYPKIFKNHFLVATVVFGTLFLIITFFFIIPTIKAIEKIDTEVFSERKRLENLYARGQLQKKVVGRYSQIKAKSAFLDEILLKENEELKYITAIESAAEESGVDLKITVGEISPSQEESLSMLKFVFEVSADWPAALDWLRKIEELAYYTNFTDLAAANQTLKNSTSTVTSLKINAETYWLKL